MDISYSLWKRRFGGIPNVIGRSIRLDAENYEIVGVLPAGFAFPYRTVEIWTPLLSAHVLPPERQERHDTHFLQVVGSLRAGLSVERARAEIDGIASRYKRLHPEELLARAEMLSYFMTLLCVTCGSRS